ncbi:MAG: eukaryotic-like serine/threonine-protein kinase [Actinomycetota bacterium]|jgi:serine/threonine-protein kinase|nr:eukaryotic-like serine/threonine-protein kinase [Actinomycetota bacterium]
MIGAHLDSEAVDQPVETAADPLVGRLLDGRYRLDRPIARGGMATVYTATDTRLDRVVAVKVMRPAIADDPDFVARFAREARAAARLSSPEVVAVHDQGTDPSTGTAYLVMEYVAGKTLRDVIRDEGPLTPSRALALLEPVLRALAAAHAAGLVHRDVKPENVLLGDDGRVKVADFGLARAVETSRLTASLGLLMGTVAYVAPEQAQHGLADARTDVYAAGILLWEMLTGTPPYAGDTPLSVAMRHVNEDVPPPSQVVHGIPVAVDVLTVRATRRDPDQRPADAGAFLAELMAARATLPAAAAETQPTLVVPRAVVAAPAGQPVVETIRPQRKRKRRTGLIAWIAIAALAVLALGGGWYLGSGRYTHAPSVLKISQAAAQQKLASDGLKTKVGPAEFSDTVAKGLVLRQDPGPNHRVRKHGTVTLFLSKGADLRAVPNVVGSTVAIAVANLKSAGLVSGDEIDRFSSAAKGLVIATDPPVGTKLRPNSVVKLVVSKGPELIPVPDVQGMPEAQAKDTVNKAGFTYTTVQVFSDTVPAGVVADQSPSSGTAPRNSSIALQISKGPELVVVPNVTGKKRDDAVQQIEALGLQAQVLTPFGGGNKVHAQSPAPGSQVKKGSVVRLLVY